MNNIITTDIFIDKAKKKFGNMHLYSLLEYKNAKTKIKIECRKHGIFELLPCNYLKYGCKNCNRNIKSFEFIKKSNVVHNNKYDYSLVEYITNNDKVKIICKIHGIFEQSPHSHLDQHSGCPICFGKFKSNTEDFIKKSINIHGDKYDYSMVEYKDCKSKVKILCKIHGMFEQVVHSHLCGKGCMSCSSSRRYTNSSFIEKAIEVHGDKYRYDMIEYINIKSKVNILCLKHGTFHQNAGVHLSGHGCPSCAGTKKSNNEEFIIKAMFIHGDKYNYDTCIYINDYTKINIGCYKHGIFKQKPNSHLNAQGCPKCKNSKGELKIENILKQNYINYKTQYIFSDLKFIKHLRFDFAIFDSNNILLFLIEYNGIQHYKKDGRMSMIKFNTGKLRDKLKIDYCVKNGIKLYIIKYNENLENKMSNLLGKYL